MHSVKELLMQKTSLSVCSSLHLRPQEVAALRPAEKRQTLLEEGEGGMDNSAWPFHNRLEVCYKQPKITSCWWICLIMYGLKELHPEKHFSHTSPT